MELETIIGLEIHVQLKTKSKMFSACPVPAAQAGLNTAIDGLTMALPGTLPVPNDTALAWAVQAAYALGCTVPTETKFDRKSYFYPDLPKGYQISQYDRPIGHDGVATFTFEGSPTEVRIERLHLEEDTGKLFHPERGEYSLIDYNRAGTPLIEIVTEPDFRSPQTAKAFLQELQLLMRYLGVSDADMEKGQLRCDANISLRPMLAGEDEQRRVMYPKTEIKNLNSFRAVERALEYEVGRQRTLWEHDTPPERQSTRGWNEVSGETVLQREKESANDYRYFPEPDIPLISFAPDWLDHQRAAIGELPAQRRARFVSAISFTPDDAQLLVDNRLLADYAERVVSELKAWLKTEYPDRHDEVWKKDKAVFAKMIANWLTNTFVGILARAGRSITETRVSAENFAELLVFIHAKKITKTVAQRVLEEMEATSDKPSKIIEREQLWSDAAAIDLTAVVATVITNNPKVVEDYRAGKANAAQFLVGQVMKECQGRADATEVREMIIRQLR